MASCTFFGHRDCPDFVKPHLRSAIFELITNNDVDTFYIGHQGRFDILTRQILRELTQEFPQIHYAVVLAYLPTTEHPNQDNLDTIFPEGLETVPPRFAISWRNRWMLQHADFVITYVTHPWGGAAQFAAKARRAGKTVISLPPPPLPQN